MLLSSGMPHPDSADPAYSGGYTRFRDLNREPLFEGKELALTHLDVELTERCNNACLHCCINLPENDPEAQSRELDTGAWQAIFRQAAELGALSIRITGGEPLLREDFAELYEYVRRLGLKVQLFTNARRITPELVRLFARIPPLQPIQVSVYGMHPKSYDAATCAPGGYEEFKRGVNLLLANQVPFIVKGALLPPNAGEQDQFAAWAATIPWMEGPPGYSMFYYLRGRHDRPALARRIERLRISPEAGLSILARDATVFHKEMSRFCQRFSGPQGKRLFNCGAGHAGSVDAYGFYHACLMLRSPELSIDVKVYRLQEAVQASRVRLRPLAASNADYLERCARCFIKALCQSCPAASYAEHGALDAPVEYFCQVAHAQARYLGLLVGEERAWEVEDWKARLLALQKIER
jgi:radical SAM protein with 4Fe4S-binding SPASM domain